MGHRARGLSADGDAWNFISLDHARSRAYRWGEDGIAGFGDDELRWCLGVALWNGRDPILKERLFGLTNEQGNHGEDVKEVYYYLDALPSHAYLRMLYKYPQARLPLRRACSTRIAGAASTTASTSSSTPGCSTRGAISTSRSNMPRPRPTTS